MKIKLLLLLLLANFCIYGQYTTISDVNFENKLISLGIDSGAPDGQVLTSNVATLTFLNVSNSSITDITGIEDFTALRYFNCNNNRLTQLNLSQNTALTNLECGNNLLTTLNLTNNPLLSSLQCANNNLASLDFSNNTAIKIIDCNHNQLTSIDVSQQLLLEGLDCRYNNIKILDVSTNLKLDRLWCNNNLLKSLDLSKNNKLSVMTAHSNLLTYLNIKNGANYLFNPNASYATFYGNRLECIQVDNVEDANKIWSQVKDPMTSFSTDCGAYTLIPDVNFENKLITLGIDRDGVNGKVLTSNVASITTLNIYGNSIADLTGIQDFTSLTTLDCSNNQITTLDLSKNIKLINLRCTQNKLTTIDISRNIDLQDLSLSSNKLITIDVSKNLALNTLGLYNNNLTSLDISNNLALKNLYCNENQITSIDLSKNLALNTLWISSNKLTNLDLYSNLNLTSLNCDRNLLTSLDLTNNTTLTSLNCASNNLNCILVDDVAYAFKNWSITKDATASLTKDCNAVTLIPDINFETKLISLGLDSGIPDGKVLTINIAPIKELDVKGSEITDLTGIEAFKELVNLNVDDNQLLSLNLSSNTKLLSLSAEECQLKNIDLRANTLLEFLLLNKNQLTTLDVSSNSKLTGLHASGNKLKNININTNTLLQHLSLSDNELATLDISSNTKLIGILASKNKLQNINLKAQTLLQYLILNENELTTLDLPLNAKLYWLNINSNQLTSLNIKNGNNTLLTDISILDNPELKCIQVDDENYSNTNWAERKDPTTVYSTNCTTLGVEDSVFDKVVVHPNPTKGEITIDNASLDKATVYNSLGQLVKSFTLNNANTNNTIDLSGLPRGVYYVYLINGDAASAKKVIVE
ncbi:hypothetical protein ASE40_04370 [Flavobacterium sp. Root935]|uniref:leucine-rich repeat domain-containing protein n=1 Tax=Flavobacterium sp. Root935 TaxID=1736610 RepID=UPI00070EADF8|nr:leucine-rich repeat domain-containing protein [Flavobacterium sp. Root935]KRD63027.1 hypothetical protein ASE40_04370 [Flavobacterium sp. Root935]